MAIIKPSRSSSRGLEKKKRACSKEGVDLDGTGASTRRRPREALLCAYKERLCVRGKTALLFQAPPARGRRCEEKNNRENEFFLLLLLRTGYLQQRKRAVVQVWCSGMLRNSEGIRRSVRWQVVSSPIYSPDKERPWLPILKVIINQPTEWSLLVQTAILVTKRRRGSLGEW